MKAGKVDPELDARIRAEVAGLSDRFKARKDLTRETAAALFFRYGIYPSVQLVHSYTRLGSLTDIGKDLDDFWQTIRDKARVRIDGVDLPEDLLTRTGEVLGSLWALAVQKATDSLEGLRAETVAQVAQARRVAEQAEHRLEQAIAEADTARADSAKAHALREEAERLQAIERTEKVAALDRAAEAERQMAAEVEARREAELRFSSDLEAERQARKQSEERLAGEVRFAKMQIEESRETSRLMKERLTAVESDRNLLEAQLKRQLNTVTEQLGAVRLEASELRGLNSALVDERIRLAQRVDELLARLEQNSAARTERLKAQVRDGIRAQLVTKAAAFELVELLEAELSFVASDTEDEPDLMYLSVNKQSGPRAITPPFTSLEELESFCVEHLERYEAVDLNGGQIPEKMFWE